jgi:hypothetical protein
MLNFNFRVFRVPESWIRTRTRGFGFLKTTIRTRTRKPSGSRICHPNPNPNSNPNPKPDQKPEPVRKTIVLLWKVSSFNSLSFFIHSFLVKRLQYKTKRHISHFAFHLFCILQVALQITYNIFAYYMKTWQNSSNKEVMLLLELVRHWFDLM